MDGLWHSVDHMIMGYHLKFHWNQEASGRARPELGASWETGANGEHPEHQDTEVEAVRILRFIFDQCPIVQLLLVVIFFWSVPNCCC